MCEAIVECIQTGEILAKSNIRTLTTETLVGHVQVWQAAINHRPKPAKTYSRFSLINPMYAKGGEVVLTTGKTIKVAIKWSYLETGTVVVDVPDKTDLNDLLACKLSDNVRRGGKLKIDEVLPIDSIYSYKNCPQGTLKQLQICGIPYGLAISVER